MSAALPFLLVGLVLFVPMMFLALAGAWLYKQVSTGVDLLFRLPLVLVLAFSFAVTGCGHQCSTCNIVEWRTL